MNNELPKRTSLTQAIGNLGVVINETYIAVCGEKGNGIGPARPATGVVDAAISQIETYTDQLREVLREAQLLK